MSWFAPKQEQEIAFWNFVAANSDILSVVNLAPDNVNLTPGSKRALAIMGVCGNNRLLIRACTELHRKHFAELNSRNFKWPRDINGNPIPLEFSSIEIYLREYSKFVTTQNRKARLAHE